MNEKMKQVPMNKLNDFVFVTLPRAPVIWELHGQKRACILITVGFRLCKDKRLHLFVKPDAKVKPIENPEEERVHNAIGRNASAVSQEGQLKEAMHILCIEDRTGIRVNPNTYACLLQGCIDVKSLSEGKRVHAHMIKTGFQPRSFLRNRLVDMYSKCGSVADARHVFDKMPTRDVYSWTAMISGYAKSGSMESAQELFDMMTERDVVSWNAIIGGYVQNGDNEKTLNLFGAMQEAGMEPDHFTFTSVLSACASLAALKQGKKVHAYIVRVGFESLLAVGNALVAMYGKCGSMEDACQIFDEMPVHDVLSWVTMITGYVKCGNVKCARQVFDRMPEPGTVAWNAMISGYAQNGCGEKSLRLFRQMQEADVMPDYITFASVICASTSLMALDHGKQIHAHVIRTGFELCLPVSNAIVSLYANCGSIEQARHLFEKMPELTVVSWNAMITGYAKHGNIEDASQLFDKMIERNVVSWTAMIAGYAQHGLGELSLKLFAQMHQECMKPDQFTFGSVLSACASLAVLERGKQVHGHIIQTGFAWCVYSGNALVTMYAKCGSIDDALQVFRNMLLRDAVSWNAIIVACARHGHGKEALQFFEQMLKIGMKPDQITFIGVLAACSHAGLVEEGWHYFDSMSLIHCIKPEVDHYTCMIDLLGRAGHLDRAEDLISKMPFEPNTDVWEALLGACRIHGNIQLGEHAAECLFELDPRTEMAYVLLSNIYAADGRWDDVANMRQVMKDRGVKKKPGCSWIEIRNKVHAFMVGDRSHPQIGEIYATLDRLAGQMKGAGYVPDTDFVLHDLEEEHKEHILCYHSEKLAIAFGLMSTPHSAPVRIIKNLRVCGDCHTAIKFISRVAERQIVVRDVNRFHHFKDGFCSCGDYW